MSINRLFQCAAMAAAYLVCASAHAFTAVVLNAQYTSPGNIFYNQLDVYAPNAGAATAPATIIFLHGGNYNTGGKEEYTATAQRCADLGFVCITANYTLSIGGTSFPQTMTDVYGMIAWVRTIGMTQYQLPDRIVVGGFSAGATIASAAALSADVPGAFLAPPLLHPRGYSVDGLFHGSGRADLVWNVQTYGQIDAIAGYLGTYMVDAPSQALYAQASAISYVNSCSPPTVLYSGSNDGTVPVGNAIRLANSLLAAGVPADLHTPFTGHSIDTVNGYLGLSDILAVCVPWMLANGQPACGRAGTPVPVGACCVGGSCSLTLAGACNGFFSGNNTTCQNSCPHAACCDSSGNCTLTLNSDCAATWMSGAAACAPNPCPVPGACCAPDGSCTFTFAANCSAQFLASATGCSPTPCPQPGPCCDTSGFCTFTLQSACPSTSNWLASPASCTPNPCAQPGACCDMLGNCTAVFQAACPSGASGLIWLGPDTSCSPGPCPSPGACCDASGGCTLQFQSLCQSPAAWQGAGSSCSPNICPQPGACCDSLGACSLISQSACTGASTWIGAAACSPGTCPQAGACCAADGSCTLEVAAACSSGQFLGVTTTCSPNNCPQPGACCASDGSCTVGLASACGGGSFLGQGSACIPQACPQPGACCLISGCAMTTQPLCSGAWIGAGSTCGPGTCASLAACCNGTNCMLSLRNGCSGVVLTGYACIPGVCDALATLGACCTGGTCSVVPGIQCQAGAQIFVNSSVTCNAPGNSVTPCCTADFNKDAHVTVQDIFSFLSAWFAGSPAADIVNNGAGRPTVESIFRFLAAWFGGCSSHLQTPPDHTPTPAGAGRANSGAALRSN